MKNNFVLQEINDTERKRKAMLKLEKLIRKCSEVYINDGDVLVIDGGYYIDTRTKRYHTDTFIVKPICRQHIYHWIRDPESGFYMIEPKSYAAYRYCYWYVCPDCQKLHYVDESKSDNLTAPLCYNKDGERIAHVAGKCFLIKGNAVLLDDCFDAVWL